MIVVNGTPSPLGSDSRASLLDWLNHERGLPGTKKGCNQGGCGACTVLLDGQRVLACLTLAVQCDGRTVTTVEGLATPQGLHPLQQAFIAHDGFQCGYCTPGQLCSALGMADEIGRGVPSSVTPDLTAATITLTREEIAERMSGNLCRCGAYNGIVGAIAETFAKAPRLATPFAYERPAAAGAAIALAARGGAYLGGGTNLVDLMREGIEHPAVLVDVSRLSRTIDEQADGGLRIGAGASNTEVASHPLVRRRYPVLAQAILNGASGQIRNMATVGGNLLQRTRCLYFYDDAAHCNKRLPGAGCDAVGGHDHQHAILGASSHCVATHPSDMCVALAALGATVQVEGPTGARAIDILDFHVLPGDTPRVETTLLPAELITAVTLPALPFAARSIYRKVRERASYAFALVSVAAAIEVDHGVVTQARIALGGVAHKPWRAPEAEALLVGQPPVTARFEQAAARALRGARPLAHNGFKLLMAERLIVAALEQLAATETAT